MEVYVKKIVKILLIIAVVLCLLSILLPWGEISYSGFGGNTYYCWGMNAQASSVQDNPSQWLLYISILDDSNIYNIAETNSLLLPVIFATILIIFVIGAILLGISSLFKIDKNRKTNSIEAGIFAIVSVISFYIFIQFGILSISGILSPLFSYSVGFYFMIISGILFFIAFGLISEFIPVKSKKSEHSKDTPFDILKMRYVTGEITKEEFEQKRKDIED